MPVYNLITIIIVFTAIFGYINFKYIKLPGTVGIMLISLVASLLLIIIGLMVPSFFTDTKKIISGIDFHTALMKVMLSFLLFAGAIQIDVNQLKKESLTILTFSTIGVLISTFIVAILFYVVTMAFGFSIDFIYLKICVTTI